MGSGMDLEEEKLLQMVHDFIEPQSTISSSSLSSNFYNNNNNHTNSSSAQKHASFVHSTRYFTLQEILKKKTEEEREINEKVGKHMRKKMEMEKSSGLKQWLVKCLKLEGIHASLSHTSWVTTPSCPSGNYEYIEVIEEDGAKGGTQRIIVDIDFKSQFEVARPTKSYKDLLNKLPNIFVGREDKLKSIISLLCPAAEESLKERGLHIPPWRRAPYMHSKWKLSNCNLNNHKNPVVVNNGTYNHNVYPNYNDNASDFGKWVPQGVMKKGRRRRDLGGGRSGLSNQFSNMSINCC